VHLPLGCVIGLLLVGLATDVVLAVVAAPDGRAAYVVDVTLGPRP